MELSQFDLSDADLDTVFQAGTQCGIGAVSLKDIISHLKKVYCQSIGVEYMYIRDPKKKEIGLKITFIKMIINPISRLIRKNKY